MDEWGRSSAGRAVGSQSTGRRFDPARLHWSNFYQKMTIPSEILNEKMLDRLIKDACVGIEPWREKTLECFIQVRRDLNTWKSSVITLCSAMLGFAGIPLVQSQEPPQVWLSSVGLCVLFFALFFGLWRLKIGYEKDHDGLNKQIQALTSLQFDAPEKIKEATEVASWTVEAYQKALNEYLITPIKMMETEQPKKDYTTDVLYWSLSTGTIFLLASLLPFCKQ